jgi:predicted NAD/FAD-binding protein
MERAPNPGTRVPSLAVVGAGWAGLAAAVRACERGFAVSLYEMAPQAGGRARRIDAVHDNGQHILIGAYRHTLALMRAVGADPERLLLRLPLELRFPDGRGLRLPPGRPLPAFARAVLGATGWTWPERLALLATASRWAACGFRCDAALSVDTLCAALPRAVRELLIDPLCVAALNTPAREASAAVWLRVLRDALFGGPGSADLLLPTAPLSALLPEPALTLKPLATPVLLELSSSCAPPAPFTTAAVTPGLSEAALILAAMSAMVSVALILRLELLAPTESVNDPAPTAAVDT